MAALSSDGAANIFKREIFQMTTSTLRWHRAGDWNLVCGRRRFGRVYADARWPGMWRSTLPDGRASDMANLSWAKNTVLAMAEREIEWESSQKAA